MAKRIMIMLVMAISAIQCCAQLESSDLEECYEQIRADIVKDACNIIGYTNKVALDKIKSKSLKDFYEELKKDTCDSGKKLYSILNKPHKKLSGTNVLKYDTLMTMYSNAIKENLLEEFPGKQDIIIESMRAYIEKIHKLTEECNCFNRSFEYQKKYPNGRFKNKTNTPPKPKGEAPQSNNGVGKEGGTMSSYFVDICIAIVALLVVGILVFKINNKRKIARRKKREKSPVPIPTPQTPPTPLKPMPEPSLVPPIQEASFNAFSEDAGEWIVVGASVQGNGHISMDLPCQDSCGYKYLQDGWGIAVTSDGAGSAKNSQVGSAIAVQRAIVHFENLIRKENWIAKDTLPTESQWMKCSYKCLKLIHDEIEAFSKQKNVDFKSLSSTIIVVIHTPIGLLVCHIGDGRAGYMDMEGQWHSLITPHKGEEANQTIFIPSEFWNIPFYEMSGAVVPEARIITSKVSAFTLMSDGCESTSWQCNLFDEAAGKYYDPNTPHKPFFDSVVETLKYFRKDGIPHEERKNKWAAFIKDGNKSFIKESDDKTMIVGALYR